MKKVVGSLRLVVIYIVLTTTFCLAEPTPPIPDGVASSDAKQSAQEAADAAARMEVLGSTQDKSNDTQGEIDALKEQNRILQKRIGDLESMVKKLIQADERETNDTDAAHKPSTETQDAPAPPPEAVGPETTLARPADTGRALLLPDISLIGTFSTHFSNDKRDPHRNRVFLDSAEIGIQSYVYPGVRADAFIAMSYPEHSAAVEEAYLTLLHPAPRLGMRLGKTKVPFGRVNQLHLHSWLYVTQPSVLANLVGPESLAGQGISASYLIPSRRGFFAQLDAGLWNSPEEPGYPDTDPAGSILTDRVIGRGASFKDRFGTLRLWTSFTPRPNSEIELGLSHARGAGVSLNWIGPVEPQIRLSGLDFSFRRFQGGCKRLLLRGEYYQHHNNLTLNQKIAKGYYILADQRLSADREFGLRYDWSQFPYLAGLHESSVSAIVTNQLTEQTFLRLQITHGSRPGRSSVNEAWLQWVWGVGPHTHNLE